MNKIKRIAIILAFVSTSIILPALPAQAHAFNYCGHGIHWHWGSRSEYIRSYQDSHGRHRHVVYVAKGVLGRYWNNPICPTH